MSTNNLTNVTWGFANRGGHHDWPFVMAQAKGFFTDEGINLTTRTIPGGDALAAAMGRGEIQIGRMGTPPFLQAIDNGSFPDGKMVASHVMHNLDHFFLVVRPDIQSLAELKGERIGVLSNGSCDGHLMKMELRRAGLDPDRDVTFVELRENYESLDGMARNEYAAKLTTEPMLAAGEIAGVLRLVEPVSVAEPHFQWGLLVARDEFVQQQPDLLKRLLSAHARGARYCQHNPTETKAMVKHQMPDYSDLVIDLALTRTLPLWNVTGELDLPGVEVAINMMLAIGSIKQRPSLAEITDLRGLG
ncbi:MAG: ABC transporter substrate-binding protein [Immundisolibacteraceae bacterium]|nr:ABC transporter substrate-binding protein [Immundisolibacteraceae bacterium]